MKSIVPPLCNCGWRSSPHDFHARGRHFIRDDHGGEGRCKDNFVATRLRKGGGPRRAGGDVFAVQDAELGKIQAIISRCCRIRLRWVRQGGDVGGDHRRNAGDRRSGRDGFRGQRVAVTAVNVVTVQVGVQARARRSAAAAAAAAQGFGRRRLKALQKARRVVEQHRAAGQGQCLPRADMVQDADTTSRSRRCRRSRIPSDCRFPNGTTARWSRPNCSFHPRSAVGSERRMELQKSVCCRRCKRPG